MPALFTCLKQYYAATCTFERYLTIRRTFAEKCSLKNLTPAAPAIHEPSDPS